MSDERWMRQALEVAERAAAEGEVPVGAVIVAGDHLVVAAANARESERDPTAHAELIALREAARKLGRWRLFGATLYVTLEPCAMCAGALVNARVERLVYGADDPKAGAIRSLFAIADDARLNHRVAVTPGVLAEDASALLKRFFRERRAGDSNPR
ncbi:MAG: tRNA adenosine(34) deaminase TadA [Deltaproteobacteria bacterium]|nr:tRNA adenosine(34) deaminase TadA [Deltaproteobacteria bacterium]